MAILTKRLAEAADGRPLLCVLDDVWEAEVVRAFEETGLHLLVTTRLAAVAKNLHSQRRFTSTRSRALRRRRAPASSVCSRKAASGRLTTVGADARQALPRRH